MRLSLLVLFADAEGASALSAEALTPAKGRYRQKSRHQEARGATSSTRRRQQACAQRRVPTLQRHAVVNCACSSLVSAEGRAAPQRARSSRPH